jgi:hypothetical protein
MPLLIAAALVAQAVDPLCPQIARLIEGARDEVPFARLRAEGVELRLLERHPCFADGRGWHCKRSLLPATITEESAAGDIAACLPDAKISVEKADRWAAEQTVVRGSGLVFALDESGSDESHVGRTLYILVRSAAVPAPAGD